jgi:hypothetical protein
MNDKDVSELMDTGARAMIVAAWCDGKLSEGQAAKAMRTDRVTARTLRDTFIQTGVHIYDRLVAKGGSYGN